MLDFVVPERQTDIFNGKKAAEKHFTRLEIATTKSVSGFDDHTDPQLMCPQQNVQEVDEEDGLPQQSTIVTECARTVQESSPVAADSEATESLATQHTFDLITDKVKQ